jgi:hypothetical protein
MLLRPLVKRVTHLVTGGCRSSSAIGLVLLAAAFVAGCATSSTISQAPDPVKCQVSLAAPPMMDAGGGAGSLAVTTQAECAWDATTTANWISGLTPASGQGPASMSFRVAANDGSSARDGVIVVNGEQVRVSQRAPCRIDLGPSSQSVGTSGGAGRVTIATANECAWTATAEASWVSLSSTPSGNGNGAVSFTVAPNQGATRTSAIAVGNQRSTITQTGVGSAPACDATISPSSHNAGAAGGAGPAVAVTVASSCQWTAVSGASWISVTNGATGTGNGTVTFTVAANSGATRTATMTIAGRGLTVSQAASGSPAPPPPPAPPTCTYSISPSNSSVSTLGGAGSVTVSTTSGCAWTAVSNAAWITVTSGASGTGGGSVGYLVLANIGGSRTGTVTIAGQTFTLTQAALLCSYSISPGNQEVQAAAGTGSVAVSTSSGCAWTASSNESWITVTSGASGSGNGTVTFSYTANTDKKRKGSLTVAGRNANVEQREGDDDDDD